MKDNSIIDNNKKEKDMKRLYTLLLASLLIASAAEARPRTLVKVKPPVETRKAIEDSLRTGRYYLQTTTTMKLVPRTEKTKGLKSRSTTIFIRPRPEADGDKKNGTASKTV